MTFKAKARLLFSSIFGHAVRPLGLALVFAGVGFVAPSAASCTTGSWSEMQPFMEAFVLDPAGILHQFPAGGEKMFFALKGFLAADTRLVLPTLIKLIRIANAEQKKSIGHALGTAAYKCRFADPDTSQRIKLQAKQIRDQIVMLAYSGSLHDEEAETNDKPQTASLSGLSREADWPGNGLNITDAPRRILGANSFKLQLTNISKQKDGRISFLPQAH